MAQAHGTSLIGAGNTMSNGVHMAGGPLVAISRRVMNYNINTLGIEMPRRRMAGAASRLKMAVRGF
jgi:hypothetical protein